MDPLAFDPLALRRLAYLVVTGLAAGCLGLAVVVDALGDEEDRRVVRSARWLAVVLAVFAVLIRNAGLLAVARPLAALDPGPRPLPFGPGGASWDVPPELAALVIFGMIVPLARGDRAGRRVGSRLVRRGGRAITRLGACVAACLLGSGILDPATPGGAPSGPDTLWIGPLLLGSSASMGVNSLLLFQVWRAPGSPSAMARLEQLDRGLVVLQGLCLAGLAATLGGAAAATLGRWPGVLIPAFVVPVGWILPLTLRVLVGPRASSAAAILSLLGAIGLRLALVTTPGAPLVGG